jgi:hypothetical protein
MPDGCKQLKQIPSPALFVRFSQLKAKISWRNLDLEGKTKTTKTKFQNAYAGLAEELEIAMERVIWTIVKANAEGFSHGIFGLGIFGL